jgi:hypothetical protein
MYLTHPAGVPVWALPRAGAAGLQGVLALQQAAYAENRPPLGVEPTPLLAHSAHVPRKDEHMGLERDGGLLAT